MSEHLAYYPRPIVLIVENDILERVSKAGTLRRQGLEVFEAADVAEAVTLLKKIAVDVLIADDCVFDGVKLARVAQEHQPTTQVVWMVDLSQQVSPGAAVFH
jgi:DNA-binding NtrC family response regulator